MTFEQWFFGWGFDNPRVDGPWKLPHILVLLTCIATIITLACIFRKRSEKARKIVLWVLVGIILFFEITRRVKNIWAMIATDSVTVNGLLYDLLPRPWCAIACWSLIISVFVKKKFFYNFASITALLCAIIYFAYPGAGFNNKYIQFENLYSITTHAMLLVTSISLITLKFTKFEYKTIWKELICLAVVYLYAFLEIYVLDIASDPLYFMPNGDIQDILGVGYAAYLPIYLVFVTIYINIFYLINDRKTVFKKLKK